ncbi:MFS transporter [Nocardia salmonicida]|uniref:MFS transporter n=1 Tax=Nocardia salmonicida TaxID=53431 RepID=UPI003717163A
MASPTVQLPTGSPAPARTRGTSPRAHTGRTLPVFVLSALLATGQMYTPIPLFGAMKAEWGVGAGVMTWVISAFAFGYAGGFVLFGPLSDRYGHRRVLVTGMLVAAVVTLLTGLAFSAPVAVALRIVQGLVVGSIPPAIMAYVGTRIAPAHRAVVTMSVATSFLAATVIAQIVSQAQMVLGVLIAATAMVAATFEGSHLAVLTVLLAILVGGLGVIAPAVLQSAGELGGEARAAASSVAMFSFYVGATIGPIVAAAAAPHGFSALAWTLALLLVIALGLTLFGARLQRSASSATAAG